MVRAVDLPLGGRLFMRVEPGRDDVLPVLVNARGEAAMVPLRVVPEGPGRVALISEAPEAPGVRVVVDTANGQVLERIFAAPEQSVQGVPAGSGNPREALDLLHSVTPDEDLVMRDPSSGSLVNHYRPPLDRVHLPGLEDGDGRPVSLSEAIHGPRVTAQSQMALAEAAPAEAAIQLVVRADGFVAFDHRDWDILAGRVIRRTHRP